MDVPALREGFFEAHQLKRLDRAVSTALKRPRRLR